MRTFNGQVFITPHAKEKFIKRRLLTNIHYDANANVYRKMLNMLFRSKLIKYLTLENGKLHEYRENKGVIFVCERVISKDFFSKDLVTVITVELTSGNLRTMHSEGLDIRTLEIGNKMEERILF